MSLKHLLIFILFFLSKPLFSQDTSFIEKIKIPTFIDTLFIDRDRNNWSIRLFTNYKINKFQLKTADENILYKPNNPMGWGVGLGTRKLIFDLAFNIKQKDKEPTKRFDFQAILILNHHYMNLVIQTYQGYNVITDNLSDFRPDIRSYSSVLSYLYMFNTRKYSLAAMNSGLARQKKPAINYGLGGFIFLDRIYSDSSILSQDQFPDYNDELRIVNLPASGAGVHTNFSASFPFLKYFLASVTITPSIGLVYKYVDTESISYHPKNPLMYHFDLTGLIGYSGNRYYITFSMGYSLFKTSLDFGNSILYNTSRAKLALGYKLGRNNRSK
jgi:hypothetical protein